MLLGWAYTFLRIPGGMALGGVLGPPIGAGAGWQGLFYFTAPIAVILTFCFWRFIHTDETKKIHEHGDTVIDKHLLDSRHSLLSYQSAEAT